MRRIPLTLVLMIGACSQLENSCPSPPGGACEPRNAACPIGYYCSLAEVCTRACDVTTDCWVPASNGCLFYSFPGQQTDAGSTDTAPNDGFCPDSKSLECIAGFCQPNTCADGGCDYDLYGPSEFKGNRTTGPTQ